MVSKEKANRAIEFIEMLKHTKAPYRGKPFVLKKFQRDIIGALFGTLNGDGVRQYRKSYVEMPRKNGKALDVDTPMLTTSGWTTMGGLQPGDFVFAPNGSQTKVIAVSEVWTGHDSYRVTFSDGRSVVADAGHDWMLFDRYAQRCLKVDTKTVSGRYRVGNRLTHIERRYSVSIPGPIQLPPRELPLDPYVLGMWLGDGSSKRAEFTGADDELFDAIRGAGFQSSYVYMNGHGKAKTIGFLKLKAILGKLGVIGNKHVPDLYLLGSIEQRRALLAGLLDTDGSVVMGRVRHPRVEFTSTKRVLAEAVLFLARSLGWKATSREGRARLNGRDCGPKWRVTWTTYRDESPFRLDRKTIRLPERPEKSQRSRTLQIVDVVQVPSVPTRCIQVEHESGMYLAGRDFVPTHNSELAAAIALYLLFAGDGGDEIYSCAGDRDQAAIVFDVAADMVRLGDLRNRFKIIDHRKRIVYHAKGSFYHAISAEAATKHGYNASGVIFDELHVQPNRKLWDVMTTSSGTRRQPLIFAITTAGYDRQSICWEQHAYAEAVQNGIVKDPSFYPAIYSAPEDADWTDEEVWYKCNPALGDFRSLEEMRSLFREAKQTPALENTFRRLYLCQWTQQEKRWMPIDAWDAAAGEVDAEVLKGKDCYAGLDLASTSDLAAFVMVFPYGDGEHRTLQRFWIPEDNIAERVKKDRVPYDQWRAAGLVTTTPGNVIDYRYIFSNLMELREQYNIREVAYDRWGATQLVQELQGEGFTMVPFGQGFASMAAPTKELMELVLTKKLHHGGNPVLRWMANNMVVRQDPAGNLKPDKGKSTEKIDGMVALIMALDRASRHGSGVSVYEERGAVIIR